MPMDAIHIVNVSMLLLFTVMGIVLFRRSHRWEGISQNARIEGIEKNYYTLAQNYNALSRDVGTFHEDYRKTLEAVLNEVRIISNNGAKTHPLQDEIEKLQASVDSLEKDVTGLPCYLASKRTEGAK